MYKCNVYASVWIECRVKRNEEHFKRQITVVCVSLINSVLCECDLCFLFTSHELYVHEHSDNWTNLIVGWRNPFSFSFVVRWKTLCDWDRKKRRDINNNEEIIQFQVLWNSNARKNCAKLHVSLQVNEWIRVCEHAFPSNAIWVATQQIPIMRRYFRCVSSRLTIICGHQCSVWTHAIRNFGPMQ